MDASLPKKHRPIEEITIVRLKDDRYPPLLRRIPDAPRQLYVRGNADALVHAYPVAFVGTRKATSYGYTAARLLAGPMARAGAAIVSGLALGTDAACHEAALEVGGLTIAVLPGGLDDESIAPPSHLTLAHRILDNGGALISEMPPGAPVQKFSFPLRNRIIAGMCKATVVIEAARRSGALITARHALDANRDVWCVPGMITAPQSQGTNDWISKGANVMTSPEELLADLGLVRFTPMRPSDTCEAAILESVEASPKTVDALVAETGFPLRDVLAATTALSLKNLVTEHRGTFIKN